VGHKKWQELLTKLSTPFFNVRYFDKAELDRAWQWLLGDRRGGPPGRKSGGRVSFLSGLANCHHA
jgi:hypothetical protein